MRCREMERRIALQVSGDLDRRGERLVREHLASCESCARLAAELRTDLDELRALRGEPADEAALAAVRRSVLADLESRRARTFSPAAWILALSNLRWAAVAVAVLVAAAVGPEWVDRWKAAPEKGEQGVTNVARRDASGSAEAQPASETVPGAIAAREVEATPTRRQPAMNTARAAGVPPPPPAPQDPPPEPRIEIIDFNANSDLLSPPATLVKLTSSDPNVVLFWLVGSDGG